MLELRKGLAPVTGGEGFFLRSETAYGMLNAMSDFAVRGYGDRHAATVSHGEGYLQVLQGRVASRASIFLDEPEAPLSFESCLSLIQTLLDVVAKGGQVICATHSPLLAALPGATIVEITGTGMEQTSWDSLSMVDHWRRYLSDPYAYLQHLVTL